MKFHIFAAVFIISAILATTGNANADNEPASQRAADILQAIGGWANQAKDAIADRANMDSEDRDRFGMLSYYHKLI